ncbi:hypothetical protein NMY22_g2888 [Coprinellus aureogranulatus]|nr:hypothetical protein NMY22_g2888 [Coprinellus aureogranulatus]
MGAAPSHAVVDVVKENKASESEGLLLPAPSTPPRNSTALPDISPNPFPDPVASLDTHTSYIYGSIGVNAPVEEAAREAEAVRAVTVLTARRKKKRAD